MRIVAFLALLAGVQAMTVNVYVSSTDNFVDEECYGMPTAPPVPAPVPPSTNCVSFIVGTGTGCSWMCQYCANQLGTNNYYFTDSVCTYEPGGCVGSPVEGGTYTCCSA
jgi:hypothetical protein